MQPPSQKQYEKLVYRTIYPSPTDANPESFEDFVRDYIIEEIRWEACRFYGAEEERDAREDALYPGHDYSTRATRIRLGPYPAHKKLFSAFDELGLTPHAIHRICIWEGTRAAKEKHESYYKTKIVDTTLHPFALPLPRRVPTVTHHRKLKKIVKKESVDLGNSSKWSQMVDYYSDPTIWSNPGTAVEARVQASEDGFRQAFELSGASHRSTSQRSHSWRFNSQPGYTDWNRWADMAHQYGVIIPTGPQHNHFLSHMPTHFAYASPSPSPRQFYTPSTRDVSVRVSHGSQYSNSLPAFRDDGITPENLSVRRSTNGGAFLYASDARATESFTPYSPIIQRRTRTRAR